MQRLYYTETIVMCKSIHPTQYIYIYIYLTIIYTSETVYSKHLDTPNRNVYLIIQLINRFNCLVSFDQVQLIVR